MAKVAKSRCTHPRSAREIADWHAKVYTYNCGVCGKENVPAPVKAPVIKPGIYKLTKPVENPYGNDGRSNDWQKQGVIKPGVFFVVEDWTTIPSKGVEDDMRVLRGNRVYKDNVAYQYLNHTQPAYDDFLAALEPMEPSDEQWLAFKERVHNYDASADWILLQAMKQGMLTRAQVEELIAKNEADSAAELAARED